MKKQQPSVWTVGLGALDLGWEHVSDVKRSFRDYDPVPFKAVAGGALLTLGLGLVAMDLVRWYPLRTWWVGELARRSSKGETESAELMLVVSQPHGNVKGPVVTAHLGHAHTGPPVAQF